MANNNTPAIQNADDFTATLMEAGFLQKSAGGSSFNRIKLQGSNLVFEKEVIASYNAKNKEPALIVQLTDLPVEYQSMWFEPSLAMAVGRPEIGGHFCKSHFDTPGEARKFAEDGTSCETCPVNPFKRQDELPPEALAQQGASKCSWKGDVEFRILDKQEDGTYASSDETVYTLSLPTTGIIEFKGSNSRKADKMAGSVSAENFMVKLAKLGMEKWGKPGLIKAHTALRMGGVIAEIHIPLATSADGSRNYNVVSFNPIEIIDPDEQGALETSEAPATDESTGDANPLPF